MPDVVCPMPTAHSYNDVKSAYDKARKAMPQLTPAAWRKAAAQDLGMDYATFLKVWKAKPGKPVIPVSTPTLPMSAAPAPTMGLVEPVVKTTKQVIKKPNTASVKKVLEGQYIKKEGYTKVKYTQSGQVYGGGSSYIPGYKQIIKNGDDVSVYLTPGLDVYKIEAAMKKLADEGWYVKKTGDVLYISKKQILGADYVPGFGKPIPPKVVNKPAAPAPKPAPEPPKVEAIGSKIFNADYPDGVIVTKYGYLDNTLARQCYNKAKKDMPNATPAVWRKSAAEYLDVDYKDYLKAWKTKKTSASYTTPIKPGELPPSQSVPLKVGKKYDDTHVPTYDSVKDDFAALYGPGAQKQYINPSQATNGAWTVQVPKSLFPSPSQVKVIGADLEKLGYDVKVSGHNITVSTKGAQAAQKAAQVAQQAAFKAGEKTGFVRRLDGFIDWRASHARQYTQQWLHAVTAAEKAAATRYTGGAYRAWNAALRKGNGIPDSTHAKVTKELDSGLAKGDLPFDVTLWRGTSTPQSVLNTMKPGAKFSDHGYGSTAIDENKAWPGNTLFRILAPKGTKSMFVDPISNHQGEMEFIMPRGTEYRITGITKQGGKTVIDMVVIKQPVR